MYYLPKCIYINTYSNLAADSTPVWSEEHLETPIKRSWIHTWRLWLCEQKMNLEAVFNWVWRLTWRPGSTWTKRCTWRQWSSKFGAAYEDRNCVKLRDALGGHDWASLEMHLQVMMERVKRGSWRPRLSWTMRCTWRPWLNRFRNVYRGHDWVELSDALWGRNWACLEMYLEAQLNDTLRGCDQAILQMHSKTEIEWAQSCSWWLTLSEFGNTLEGHNHANSYAVIEQNWRCTLKLRSCWSQRCSSRLWSSEFGDALGGWDRACLEWHMEEPLRDALGGCDEACLGMHFETKIKWAWTGTWLPSFSKYRNTPGGNDHPNSDALIKQVWSCTWRPKSCWTQRCHWRPWLSMFGDVLGGRDLVELGDAVGGRDQACWEMHLEMPLRADVGDHDQVSLEMHLEAVIERVGRFIWRQLAIKTEGGLWGSRYRGGRSGGQRIGSRDSMHWVTFNHGNVVSWVQQGPPRDEGRNGEWLAGSRREPIVGWCSTRCMV